MDGGGVGLGAFSVLYSCMGIILSIGLDGEKGEGMLITVMVTLMEKSHRPGDRQSLFLQPV